MASAAFIAKCQAKTDEPSIVFTYNTTDYSDYVINISPISRDAEMTAGVVTVKLNNGAGTFNSFLNDWTVLGKQASVAFNFAGLAENHTLFTGYVDTIEMGLDTITMTLKDRLATCLAKTVGSGEVPVTYDGNFTILGNVVWAWLTTYAGLNATASTANPDIDYTAWGVWWNELEDSGNEYRLSAYLTGQTVANCLKRIMELTNSYIWVNGAGKITFEHYTTGNVGAFAYEKEYCLDRVYKSTMDGVIGYVKAYYGFDTTTWEAAGNVAGQLIVYTSAQDLVEEDISIWHATVISATRYVNETLARLNPPISTFTIQTAMAGFISDVGNTENLLNHYSAPDNTIDVMVDQITYDVMNWETTILASKVWAIS